MDLTTLRQLLVALKKGEIDIEQAILRFRRLPFEDLGFAKIDHHRALRCGFPEVIYSERKSAEEVVQIFSRRVESGSNVLATRASPEVFQAIASHHKTAQYHERARCVTLRQRAEKKSSGKIAIVSAGTADLPVAEEARVTAEIMDQSVFTYYDVGVAGIHRLLSHLNDLQEASVLIVVAGMEGALPSVVGGLVAAPVIAVPTSVGYGAHLGGIAPLLAMLNSCASNVAVVNIDNGFGAGYLAATMNRVADKNIADVSRS